MPLAAEILTDYINQIPFLELKSTCSDALYALEVLQAQRIDLLFLDIHLPKLKGLDFIRTLKSLPRIILTTAYREYALDGYELNVVDYLLKPIHFNRFLMAVNKVKEHTIPEPPVQNVATVATERPHLLINVNKKGSGFILMKSFISKAGRNTSISLPPPAHTSPNTRSAKLKRCLIKENSSAYTAHSLLPVKSSMLSAQQK